VDPGTIPASGRRFEGSAVQPDTARRPGHRTRLSHGALFLALSVVRVLELNSFANAASTSDAGSNPRPGLSDAQRACLSAHGITTDRRDDAEKPFAKQQRHELRAAARGCGVRGLRVAPLGALTDEQRQCLADQGATVPPHSVEERRALRAAAAACGLRGSERRAADATI
jgi:hypothetical protein